MAGFALEVWRGTASRRQLKAIYEAAWFKKSKRANCKGILHAAATIRGLISRVVVARERNLSAYLISRSVLDRRTQEYLSPVFRKHNGAAPASRRIMPANKDKGKIEEREKWIKIKEGQGKRERNVRSELKAWARIKINHLHALLYRAACLHAYKARVLTIYYSRRRRYSGEKRAIADRRFSESVTLEWVSERVYDV